MTDEPRYRDEDWLREQYQEQKRTTAEIANECDCAQSTISRWLGKNDIETRDHIVVGHKPLSQRGLADERLADYDWLYKEYVEKKKSTIEIAEENDIGGATVSRWLERHGINTRSRRSALVADSHLTDGSWLREQYVQHQKSVEEIADFCDCHRDTVSKWISRHGIQFRKPVQTEYECLSKRDWLYNQYATEGKSTIDIAEEVGCAPSTVNAWLHRHGVETRDRAVGTGPEHPRWSGGRVFYGAGWNDDKKRVIRERDGRTCQEPRCDMTQTEHLEKHGQKLHVHHLRKARDIDDPEERNEPENLITLCRECHGRWEKIADAGIVPQVER